MSVFAPHLDQEAQTAVDAVVLSRKWTLQLFWLKHLHVHDHTEFFTYAFE